MANLTVKVIELRYEDYGNNNHKFYRAYLWAGHALTQWGRIGARGQYKMISAMAGRNKIDEKLGQGYQQTSWADYEVPEDLLFRCEREDSAAFADLSSLANYAIGNKVAAQPAVAPARSLEQEEEELTKRLLAMRGKYTEPEPVASAPTPEAPQVDPDSIEGRLGAALAAAKEDRNA